MKLGGGPVLVTGSTGQLAMAMQRAAGPLDVRRAGRPMLDFERPDSIDAVFDAIHPGVVVNAAAWTAVDLAETHEAEARRANRDGPERIARLCATAGIPLIHISTDYVFDGRKGSPYVETDATSPTGLYGRTKLEGEHAVIAACPTAIVLRTSWVYSRDGKNFVRTMLGAAAKARVLRVVADQRGCPTTADDLAQAIVALIGVLRDGWRNDYAGIYHAAGTGWTTWHGLATAAFEDAERHGLVPPVVEPIATADWPTPAARPADSRLDCGALHSKFQISLPEWRLSLRRTVSEILN